MRDVHPSMKICQTLNSRKVLSDDWSYLIWMSFHKLQPGVQLQAVRWIFFLDGWEMSVPHPFTRQLSSMFEFIYWWLTLIFIDSWLCVKWVWVVRDAGLFSCKQLCDFFSTDERFAHKKVLTVFKLIWIYWVMIEHILVEWAFTNHNQVFSCNHFRDFFSTDEESSFLVPWHKLLTAVKHFWFFPTVVYHSIECVLRVAARSF